MFCRFFCNLLTLLCFLCVSRGAHAQRDPDGGSWKTIVIGSTKSIRVGPPSVRETPAARTNLDETARAEIAFWKAGAAVRWNEFARRLVAEHRVNPPQASPIYAALSVAQYDSAVTAWHYKREYANRASRRGMNSSYPSEHSAVSRASSAILKSFFPSDSVELEERAAALDRARLLSGANGPGDVRAGGIIGSQVAAVVLHKISSDGSDASFLGDLPAGVGVWRSSANPPLAPLLPM
jgi:hypothetical protein